MVHSGWYRKGLGVGQASQTMNSGEREVAVEHRVEDCDKGTCATMALNSDGRMLRHAPTSIPPAEPPTISSRCRGVLVLRELVGDRDEVEGALFERNLAA